MNGGTKRENSKDSKAGASAAGAGGGTLLVLLGNSLPAGSRLKPWILLAAPSLSIFFSRVWLWLQVYIVNYLQDREAKSVIDSAKRTLEEALKNSNTSEGHRKKIRQQLETLELVAVDRQMERIKALRITTEEEVQAPHGST
jgi:hypothetical protein